MVYQVKFFLGVEFFFYVVISHNLGSKDDVGLFVPAFVDGSCSSFTQGFQFFVLSVKLIGHDLFLMVGFISDLVNLTRPLFIILGVIQVYLDVEALLRLLLVSAQPLISLKLGLSLLAGRYKTCLLHIDFRLLYYLLSLTFL